MEKQIIRSPSSLTPILLILLSITLTSVLPSVSAYRGMVGGRKEVENVKSNREVQELGQFSVEEFNHRRHDEEEGDDRLELKFTEVVKAEVQVVAGLKYYLKVKVTTGGGESRVYDSVVVVKPWLGRGGGSKKLLSFSPSATSPVVLDLIPLGGN